MTQGIVRFRELDMPPRELGFKTVIASGPDAASAEAGTAAVTRVLLTKVVCRLVAFKRTVAPEVKFEPTTLSVKAGPPCALLFGERALITGTGPGVGAGSATASGSRHCHS